ncbi:MAG: hypothetical protein OEV76_13025, partial [Anaerolineae bacterium]|nr:hypothetical protein [Anaerolineae bacterium]
LWTITAGMIVFSAHMHLGEPDDSLEPDALISRVNDYLAREYGIIESTIQVGAAGEAEVCEIA